MFNGREISRCGQRHNLLFYIVVLITGFPSLSSAESPECDVLYEQVMQPGFDDEGIGKSAAACYENAARDETNDKTERAEAYYRIGVARYFTAASAGEVAEMEKSRDALQKAVELDPEHAAARDQLMKADFWINPKRK